MHTGHALLQGTCQVVGTLKSAYNTSEEKTLQILGHYAHSNYLISGIRFFGVLILVPSSAKSIVYPAGLAFLLLFSSLSSVASLLLH